MGSAMRSLRFRYCIVNGDTKAFLCVVTERHRPSPTRSCVSTPGCDDFFSLLGIDNGKGGCSVIIREYLGDEGVTTDNGKGVARMLGDHPGAIWAAAGGDGCASSWRRI
ncbi:hypothetical protein MY4824_009648 [Beauveria thailandica]